MSWRATLQTDGFSESVDWKSLSDANGSCEDYPDRLKALFSSSDTDVDRAYWALENHAVLQGDLYPVAPFLAQQLVLELGSDLSDYSRVKIYDLLTELALGYSNLTVRMGEEEVKLGCACRTIIRNHFRFLESDFEKPDPAVRETLAHLILSVGEFGELDLDAIRNWRENESSPKIRQVLAEVVNAESP